MDLFAGGASHLSIQKLASASPPSEVLLLVIVSAQYYGVATVLECNHDQRARAICACLLSHGDSGSDIIMAIFSLCVYSVTPQ